MSDYDSRLGEYMAAFGEAPRSRGPSFGLGTGETGPTAPAPVLVKLLSQNEALREGLYPTGILETQLVGILAMIKATDLQRFLNGVARNQALTSGRWDNSTKNTWQNYTMLFSGELAAKNFIGPAERRTELKEINQTSVQVDNTWVWAQLDALRRLEQRAKTAAAMPAPRATTTAATAPRIRASARPPPPVGFVTVNTLDVQKALVALGAKITADGKFGPATQAAWEAVPIAPPSPGEQYRGIEPGGKPVHFGSIIGYLGQTIVDVNVIRWQAVQQLAAKSSGATQLLTADVQSLLKNLGGPNPALNDGTYGPTTVRLWQESANKRSLNPTIQKASADGKQVLVSESTWLKLRADADARGAPPVVLDDTIYIDPARMEDVIARWVGAPVGQKLTADQIMGYWTKMTEAAGLPKYIEAKRGEGLSGLGVAAPEWTRNSALVLGSWTTTKDNKKLPGPQTFVVTPDIRGKELETFGPGTFTPVLSTDTTAKIGFYVKRSAWIQMELAALKMERPAPVAPLPPPGPQRTQLEVNIEALVKASTAGVSTLVARKAFGAAAIATKDPIYQSVQPRGASWDNALTAALIKYYSVPADKVAVWQQALVPGKLLLSDRSRVKLVPQLSDSLKKLAGDFDRAAKQAQEIYKGYTEVNSAEVIARINGLGVTTKKFDRAGGYKELADAVKTFFEETKTKLPSGDLVKVDLKQKTYLKNDVLTALAAAVTTAQQRADLTKRFRDSMVANALKEAAGEMTVLSFQQALRAQVLNKSAGKHEALYAAVSTSGAFDKPTRDAYTEIARTLTIGPAVQEYQKLLQAQMGPYFKTDLVKEARNQVWSSFLDAAVAKKDGKLAMKMLPALSKQLEPIAQLYIKTTTQDQRYDEQIAAFNKALADAIKKSTATLSILNVQQALLQALALKAIPKVSNLRITGATDGQTREGLFHFNGLIFPEGQQVPETGWAKYLAAVGYIVVPGQPVKRAWVGANYIALPRALADHLAKLAGEWILKNGQAQIQVAVFNDPSVITVKVPKKEDVHTFDEKEEQRKAVEAQRAAAKTAADQQAAQAAAAAKKAAADQAAREAAARAAQEAQNRAALAAQQAENERRLKEQAAAAALAAQQAEREARLREQAARDAGAREAAERAAAEARQAAAMAAQQAEEARAAAAREAAARAEAQQQQQQAQQAAAEATLPLPPPVIAPAPGPTLPEPVQAGMGAGGILAMLAAGTAAFFLTRKDEQDRV